MRCCCCNKPIRKAALTVSKTWVMAGGLSGVDVLVYGPKCAQRLGLIPAHQQAVKTTHWPVTPTGRFRRNYLAQVEAGQIEMFEGITS